MDDRRPPAEPDRAAAARMWAAYVTEHPDQASEDAPPSECFGDSTGLADALLEPVLLGPTRVTAGAVAQSHHDGDPLPRIGGHRVVHDGAGPARRDGHNSPSAGRGRRVEMGTTHLRRGAEGEFCPSRVASRLAAAWSPARDLRRRTTRTARRN